MGLPAERCSTQARSEWAHRNEMGLLDRSRDKRRVTLGGGLQRAQKCDYDARGANVRLAYFPWLSRNKYNQNQATNGAPHSKGNSPLANVLGLAIVWVSNSLSFIVLFLQTLAFELANSSRHFLVKVTAYK